MKVKKPGRLKVALKSKLLGAEDYREHRVGTLCQYERSGACLGEFLIWFGKRRFAKINAIDLPDTVEPL